MQLRGLAKPDFPSFDEDDGETSRKVHSCMSSEPFGQVSNGFKRGSGPSELKWWLRMHDAAGVVAWHAAEIRHVHSATGN